MDWRNEYLERFYRRREGWVDGTTEFHELCKTVVPAGGRVLEIGAGPSNQTSRFLATLGEVSGLDPDPAVLDNEALAHAQVLRGDRYPFDDEEFDACVSNFVCEHIEQPLEHLGEVRRVLRPGAPYALRTPNRYHYVAAVSALTPHWFHRLAANRLRGLGPDAHDVYPTVYAMNSDNALRRLAGAAGLEVELVRLVEKEPSYGMAARALFLAGMAYERLVNRSERLRHLRSTIFAVLRRPKV